MLAQFGIEDQTPNVNPDDKSIYLSDLKGKFGSRAGYVRTGFSNSELTPEAYRRKLLAQVKDGTISKEEMNYVYNKHLANYGEPTRYGKVGTKGLTAQEIGDEIFNRKDKEPLRPFGLGETVAPKAVSPDIQSISKMVESNPSVKITKTPESIIRPNADPHYKVSVDPDTICPKRTLFGNTTKQIEKNIGRPLTSDEVYAIRDFAKSNGSEVPCPQCYVESARNARFNAPALKEQGTYNGDILKWKQAKIDDLNAHAGLRMFSKTDFKPQFTDDIMKVVSDASKRGLSGHAYTKQGTFADIFGDTGMKINMSIGGDVKDGKLVENTDIGMPWKDAMSRRDAHQDVGTVYIAKTTPEIKLALDNPQIDKIIPYHHSSQSVANRKLWGATEDFTHAGEEHWINPSEHKGESVPLIVDSMHNGDKDTYLALVKKLGLTPKFPQFVDSPNYMKLIGPEAGKFGDNSVKVMKPNFNMDVAKKVISDWHKAGDTNNAIDTSTVKYFTKLLRKK
jgi:hypothetical protein